MALMLEIRDDTEGLVLSWGGAKKAIVRVVGRKGNKSKIRIEAPHSVSITRTNPNENADPQPWQDKKRRRTQ